MHRPLWQFAVAALAGTLLAGTAEAQQLNEKRIGDWKLVCADRPPAGEPKCFLNQPIQSRETGAVILSVAIFYWPGGEVPQIVFNLAPQVDKSKELSIQIDQYKGFGLDIGTCDAKSCTTGGNLREPMLGQMKAGNRALVTFAVTGQPKRFAVGLSLKGFSTAFKALDKERK